MLLYYVCLWRFADSVRVSIVDMLQESRENTARFTMFYVITNVYNKKTKGPTLTELFTDTGKLKKVFFFDN
jgi:hypothetical protein